MKANYSIDDSLPWNESEKITIEPKGWKPLTISYIESSPYVFWRINDIQKNFRSMGLSVAQDGPHKFFSDSLESLKFIIDSSLDVMTEERREFYTKNIVGLFNEQ